MPLKLRRTLSMEDLQNASDDEMDVLLCPAQSSGGNEGTTEGAAFTSSANTASTAAALNSNNNRASQRERMFPFSLISDDSTSRPRPKPNSHPIIVPVEMPDSDDFFLHGPQAPILKIDGSSTVGDSSSSKTNVKTSPSQSSSPSSSSFTTYQSIPRSKSVRFEEPDEDEFNGRRRDRLSSVQTQVSEVTQKMKDNISRLLEREANLDSLADLTDQLHHSGDIYRQSTEHLRRKLWWRQQKTRLVLTAVFIFCTALLFVPLISRLLR